MRQVEGYGLQPVHRCQETLLALAAEGPLFQTDSQPGCQSAAGVFPGSTPLTRASAANSARLKMVSPGWEGSRPGLSFATPTTKTCRRRLQYSARRPVSRILSCAVIPLDAALPRTFISDLPGGSGNCLSRLGASGRCAAPPWLLGEASLPIWSCSVWGLPCPRRYRRSGALLPHHFTLTPALEFPQRRAYPASRANSGIAFPGRPSGRIRRSGEG